MNQRKFDESGGEILSTERKIRWLASYPKSGNTWIRMFLNCYATRCEVDLNSAYQFVTSDLRPESYQMMMPRPLNELTLAEQFMYHAGSLINLIKLSPTKDVYCKTHNAKAIVDGFPLIPPTISGPSVYVIRDPRDVVISMAEHFEKEIDKSIKNLNDKSRAGRANFNLFHMFMDWSTHVRSWISENKNVRMLLVRYEDLLEKPYEAFKTILDQFSIEFEEERLQLAMERSSFDKLREKEDATGFVEKAGGDKFFRVGKSGQWKTILSKKQMDSIEGPNKEVMKAYGYL
jgi:hypothetical protein